MARYLGKDLVVFWVTGAGTTDVSADFRTLDLTRKVASADCTAGQDTYANKLPTFTDGSGKYTFVDNSGYGTTVYNAIEARQSGTLIWSPRGTTSGLPKKTVPAFIDSGPDEKMPYNNVVEITIGFQFTAAPVTSTW